MSFVAHASSCGLIVRDVIADDRWHRCPTLDHPRKKNGAYIFDGQRGVVRNWATMEEYSAYRDGYAERVDKDRFRLLRQQQRDERRQRQEGARRLAQDMLSRAGVRSHPYLVAKGFPAETGFVLDAELLIPMRDARRYDVLNSLQRISATGEKRFLAGGKAQGSAFFMGAARARERWLCEGYATALSVRAALRDLRREAQVIVCFSASNIAAVASALRRPAFIVADNDASNTGARVAQASGLPWGMPPEVGTDANDLHQDKGLRALARLVTRIRNEGAAEA